MARVLCGRHTWEPKRWPPPLRQEGKRVGTLPYTPKYALAFPNILSEATNGHSCGRPKILGAGGPVRWPLWSSHCSRGNSLLTPPPVTRLEPMHRRHFTHVISLLAENTPAFSVRTSDFRPLEVSHRGGILIRLHGPAPILRRLKWKQNA